MKKRFYGVRSGYQPGVYNSWEQCRAQVEGCPNSEYKGFATRHEAEEYLKPAGPSGVESPSSSESRKNVIIYTDGACRGNPGPGGYGVVLMHGKHRKELSAGFRRTTNNRMEILACIAALSALKEPCDVTIYSDSKYVVNAMTQSWALKWRSRGWKRRLKNGDMEDALNPDLWARMLELCDLHRVHFIWVRGHDGNEGNERCDALARAAAAGNNLGIDDPYERPAR